MKFRTLFFLARILGGIYGCAYRRHKCRHWQYWLSCSSPICQIGRWAERTGELCAMESIR